jgi:L-lactate dehydrogenase
MRIAIVGAGSVGATLAYACLIRGVGRDLVLHDIDAAKVEAQVLDLEHGLQFLPSASVSGSAALGICAGADVIVLTAGAKQKVGQTRLDLAAANAQMCRTTVPRLLEVAPEALLMLVTNPVDVLTHVTLKVSGLPPGRVFGSGTVLDTSRLRFALARRCGVAVPNVHANVVGEHGDSEIALWSTATIANIPLQRWTPPDGDPIDDSERDRFLDQVRGSAQRIVKGKGATNFAIGLAAARILEAIQEDERRIYTVSALLDGEYGLSDVCLSIPRLLGRAGVLGTVPVPLDGDEVAGLTASADVVRGVVRTLGFSP